MMRRSALLLSVLCLSGCATQQPAVKQDAFHGGKLEASTIGKPEPHELDVTIAILPFRNNSPDKSLDQAGVTLADLISAQMASKQGFKLVERHRMKEMLAEMKLGMMGIVDAGTAVRIGRMLGANVMAFGSISSLGKKLLLSVRLVKVETGEIVAGVNERTKGLSNLDVLAEKAADRLSDSLLPK